MWIPLIWEQGFPNCTSGEDRMHWLQCHPRTYKLCRGTPHPNSNCSARSQLSCSHASSSRRCSLPSHLPLIILCLSKAEVLALPLSSPLAFWSKSVMSAQGARGKEETRVTAIRKGKTLKWAVLCRFLPPSLQTVRCPWSCDWKQRRLLQFIHTVHRAALASLPVCMELLVSLANGERKRQTEREGGDAGERG